MHDYEAESTYCHACGQRLIGRDWYELSEWNLTAEGCCTKCQTRCAGVFEGEKGVWGRRSLPVALHDIVT